MKTSILSLSKSGVTDFSKEKNKLLENTKTEWVMFVDPDEVVTPELKKEIDGAINSPDIQGYYVYRRDFLFGRELKHGEFSGFGWFGNSKLIRLARRDAGKWERSVHEIWKVSGKTGTLKNPLLHYPHPTLNKFLSNINYFSGLHAIALRKEGKKSSLVKIIVWPAGKFVYNYFVRLGFLDGMQGFVAALMMTFHSFLSWSKEWQLQKD
jgi:hypothetical protein